MSVIRVDDSRWPIVVHSVEGTPTDAEVEDYIRRATAVLQRGGPHVTIIDSSRIGQVSAYMRTRSMQWQREYRDQLRECSVGTAYVLSSPLLRFIMMTVKLVIPPPIPYTVFATYEEALAWAERRLVEAGVTLPERTL